MIGPTLDRLAETFNLLQDPMTNGATVFVSMSGTGKGTVSDGAALSCPGTCTGNHPGGTVVVLTAKPAAGSAFTGWSGACSGTGTSSVQLTSDQKVTASFSASAPTITAISPSSGPTGDGCDVTGTNLVPGLTARLVKVAPSTGTQAANVSLVSGTQARVVIPNGAVPGHIALTTPAGTATSSATFTPTLSVTALSPTSGAPGTLVTITGVGFTSSSSVKFNGTAAWSVKFVSATKLQATRPGRLNHRQDDGHEHRRAGRNGHQLHHLHRQVKVVELAGRRAASSTRSAMPCG